MVGGEAAFKGYLIPSEPSWPPPTPPPPLPTLLPLPLSPHSPPFSSPSSPPSSSHLPNPPRTLVSCPFSPLYAAPHSPSSPLLSPLLTAPPYPLPNNSLLLPSQLYFYLQFIILHLFLFLQRFRLYFNYNTSHVWFICINMVL